MCIEELQAILEASREKEHRSMKFFAALKGIDLDKNGNHDSRDRVQQIKERVAAQQRGEDPNKVELQDHFAIEYEVEE